MKEDSPNPIRNQSPTNVIYVKKRHAKVVKVALKAKSLIDNNYRMVPAHANSFDLAAPISRNNPLTLDNVDGSIPSDTLQNPISCSQVTASDCIAIPVIKECTSVINLSNETEEWMEHIIANGEQLCPFSSSILGNTKRGMEYKTQTKSHPNSPHEVSNTVVQNVLIKSIIESSSPCDHETVKEYVKALSIVACPKKLEIIGDDRTLVIPGRSLNPALDYSLKSNLISLLSSENCNNDDCLDKFMNIFWKRLAKVYGSSRVVRRGDVDPNSKIRESGHSILWLDEGIDHVKSPVDGKLSSLLQQENWQKVDSLHYSLF